MTGKPQVMVVDDDVSMRDFLRSFLSERGYQAITLGDAEEAVKRYYSDRPAAVILDVVMPGNMDGLGALAAFTKIDHEVPIIVLTIVSRGGFSPRVTGLAHAEACALRHSPKHFPGNFERALSG
jgi:two-component system phosphate regulon response regulator OmpR